MNQPPTTTTAPAVTDQRIAFGLRCSWWGSITEVATRPSPLAMATGGDTTVAANRLPCCPHCGDVLLEVPTEDSWWQGVDLHEAEGHLGYRAFITWLRGRCYPTIAQARMAFDLEGPP